MTVKGAPASEAHPHPPEMRLLQKLVGAWSQSAPGTIPLRGDPRAAGRGGSSSRAPPRAAARRRRDYGTAVTAVLTRASITCPICGCATIEEMPVNACVRIHECRGCGAKLSSKPGDSCVFCSYADSPCPPKQAVAESG